MASAYRKFLCRFRPTFLITND